MTDSPETLKARQTWVKTYSQTGNAGLGGRTPRPLPTLRNLPPYTAQVGTLRKWARRFAADGEAGLHSKSRRPHTLADSKPTPQLTDRVLSLRRERNLGSTRMQAELLRLDGTWLSTSTIHRVLADARVKPIKRPKRPKKPKRYSRPNAGDRVQGPGLGPARRRWPRGSSSSQPSTIAPGCACSRSTPTRRVPRRLTVPARQ